MRLIKYLIPFVILCFGFSAFAQPDTIIIGFGENPPASVSASSSSTNTKPENTINQDGFLPNQSAASRFLSHATLGFNMEDIDLVTNLGVEDWVEAELNKPRGFLLSDQVKLYHEFAKTNSGDPNYGQSNRMWDYSWWQYHMTNNDALRQRVAFALSELIVVSENSSFRNEPLALSSFYDIFLTHAFGNYRDILQDVTYHPAMGQYLTFINNPKSDTSNNVFPDENYAREVMQLFTIGLYKLNMNGTYQLDAEDEPIPTYDNLDIQEFSKIFTGLTWGDRDKWNRGPLNDTSHMIQMAMWNEHHEPGEKYLLNGFIVPDRDPVNGDADITDALNNLFNHPSLPPYVCQFLIQRLVTANPAPSYVERVTEVFINNGQGVRGDLGAVIRAIILDPAAKNCGAGDEYDFGSLKEPFIRYFQLNKALNAHTLSGNYRNDMDYVYGYTGQKPLTSPSVFNFFQQNYQPIGAIEDAGKVAPVFQITDSQTISGWINGLYRWIYKDNIADENDLYGDEDNNSYEDEISMINLDDQILLAGDDQIHILLDQYNLLFAQGRISELSTNTIADVIRELPSEDPEDLELRVRMSIYLLLTSPEYLISR